MFAERFKVRSWLEIPAKWLSWARDSIGAQKPDDVSWNLQQFWKELEASKRAAQSKLDWAEIQHLDAYSHQTFSQYYALLQSQRLAALRVYIIDRKASLSPASFVLDWLTSGRTEDWTSQTTNWVANLVDPTARQMGADIDNLGQKARDEATLYSQMADKALQAFNDAGKDMAQVRYSANTASSGVNTTSNWTNQASKDAAAANREKDPIQAAKDALSISFLGVPVWLWGAGAVAAYLLVSTGPTVRIVQSALGAARKAEA